MTIDRQADAAAMYVDTGLTETVDFRTSPSATAREDLVVKVRREAIDVDGRDDKGPPFAARRAPTLIIQLRNHASLGVLPTEITPDVSQINVAFPLGDTERWRPILRIVKQTPGLIVVEVQT